MYTGRGSLLWEATCQIVVNAPLLWDNDYAIKNAVDFWYKAGYSSAEGVWSKKQYPVNTQNAARYSTYDHTDDEEETNGDEEKETDYQRRIKRKKQRHDQLKAIHIGMDEIFEKLSIKAGQEGQGQDESELSEIY